MTTENEEVVRRMLLELPTSAAPDGMLEGTWRAVRRRRRARVAGATTGATVLALAVIGVNSSVLTGKPARVEAASSVSATVCASAPAVNSSSTETSGTGAKAEVQHFAQLIAAAGDLNMTGINPFGECLQLYWRGQPDAAAQAVIEEAKRNGVVTALQQRQWTQSQLFSAVDRLRNDPTLTTDYRVSLVRVAPDFAGIEVLTTDGSPANITAVRTRAESDANGIPVSALTLSF